MRRVIECALASVLIGVACGGSFAAVVDADALPSGLPASWSGIHPIAAMLTPLQGGALTSLLIETGFNPRPLAAAPLLAPAAAKAYVLDHARALAVGELRAAAFAVARGEPGADRQASAISDRARALEGVLPDHVTLAAERLTMLQERHAQRAATAARDIAESLHLKDWKAGSLRSGPDAGRLGLLTNRLSFLDAEIDADRQSRGLAALAVKAPAAPTTHPAADRLTPEGPATDLWGDGYEDDVLEASPVPSELPTARDPGLESYFRAIEERDEMFARQVQARPTPP